MPFLRNKITEKSFFCFALFCLTSFFSCQQKQKEEIFIEEPVESTFMFNICVDSLCINEYQIKSGDNLSEIFSSFGLSGTEREEILKSSAGLLNPRTLRPGMPYYAITTPDSTKNIQHLVFARSLIDFVIVDLTGDSITAYPYTKPVRVQRKYAEGIVESSLWNAITKENLDPILAIKLADIYAWQIDFFGIQKGDAFKVIYKEAFIDDSVSIQIQDIEGAIFTHNKKDYLAIPFVQDSVRIYFDGEGNSARRVFLKAPLDFFRISSHFSNARFHPILKRTRAHHGVDYAAPVGTPVKTIGDGVVIERSFQGGGAGNYVKIKHNATYSTAYMHLSKFGAGIQKGAKVSQGQVIGYVGSTGLSTGPHLDFRVYKNGKAINPLTMETPPDTPVHESLRDSFYTVRDNILLEIGQFSKQHPQGDSLQTLPAVLHPEQTPQLPVLPASQKIDSVKTKVDSLKIKPGSVITL